MARSKSSNSTSDISIRKFLYYNTIFFVPLAIAFLISVFVAGVVSSFMETSTQIVVQLLMFFFTLLIFGIIIPYIRKNENVAGIRFALVGILIVGIVSTIPALLQGFWGLLLNQLTYLATYLLLTFVYVPEVLGITSDIEQWFQQHRQLLVIAVYVSIIFLYMAGFAYNYYEIERASPGSFNLPAGEATGENANYFTFLYYSIISFAAVGYGDITPLSTAARFVAGLETIVGLVMNVVFIAILLVYISGFQSAQQKREAQFLKKEEKQIKRLGRNEKGDIKRLQEMEKVDISHLSSTEKKDFKRILKKIKTKKLKK